MLSEALDITIESRGDTIWITLAGPFNKEQVPNIRAKIEGFIQDGHREIVVNLQDVTLIHDSAPAMFLGMLNLIKGKNGDIKLIFKNEVVSNAFSPYKNIFPVFPDAHNLHSKRLFHSIRRKGISLTKKTGIRLSVPVAFFLLIILTGWFISLGIIITMQRKQIFAQEAEIREFQQWEQKASMELEELRSRIKPLKQLGLILDSIPE
jgi:anti-anti-sigma factor